LVQRKRFLRRDHVGDGGDSAARLELCSEPVGVIGFVGDHDDASVDRCEQRLGAGQVVSLAGRDQ
jgi:hypothetical protein